MAVQLERIEIENFRSIISAMLELSAYTPIVGYNNSGKSNSIAAIQWLLRRTVLGSGDFCNAANPVTVSATVAGIGAAQIGALPAGQQGQIRPYVVDEKIRVRRTQPTPACRAPEITLSVWDFTNEAWVPNPTGIDNAIGVLLPEPIRIGAMEDAAEDATKAKSSTTIGKLLTEFLTPVRAAHHDELAGILAEVERRISAQGDLRFAELLAIETAMSQKIDELFPSISARLHFSVPTMDELIKAGTLKLIEGAGAVRDFSSYGHGTQRSVQMALIRHLADVKRTAGAAVGTTLLLIDEPELYLHPFAIEQVKAALKELSRNGYQIVFSTHSPLLVSSSDAQYTLLMRKDAVNGTHARQRLLDAIQNIVPDSVHQMEQLFTLSNSSNILFAIWTGAQHRLDLSTHSDFSY